MSLFFQVGGFLSEPYILVDVPVGKDSLIDYKHKMCPSTSKGCINSRNAVTLIILLEHGMYGGSPSSKVLMIPFTGKYLSSPDPPYLKLIFPGGWLKGGIN